MSGIKGSQIQGGGSGGDDDEELGEVAVFSTKSTACSSRTPRSSSARTCRRAASRP